MSDELFYRIALTMIPDLGPVRTRLLVEHFGNARDIFRAGKKELSSVEGIGAHCTRLIKSFKDFSFAEKELRFIEAQDVQALFLTDTAYPRRLLHCYDPPVLLYYRGVADLNTTRIISVIGTRNHTEYGKQVTEALISGLAGQQVLIVSGLAFGIDAVAHKTALHYGLPTVGVLGHGLDLVYPYQHHALAKAMTEQGGLLTEFRQNAQPDKHHFPKRNRIVAGMADATVVIETARKGGSMITAELANSYNRDLFAVPGRLNDQRSSGCLQLIKQNKAMVFVNADDLLETMGWSGKKIVPQKQKSLFVELSEEEEKIVSLLQENGAMSLDGLYLMSGVSSSTVAAALLSLEMQHVICALPGKTYRLL